MATRRKIRPAPTDDVAITITTTHQVRDDLTRLVETGFYGTSMEQAAEELMRERLRQVLEAERRMRYARAARERKRTS